MTLSFCGSCKNDELDASSKITKEEYVQLVDNARQFALERESSLKENDKELIKKSEPNFSVYYTGAKYGQFFLTWNLTEGKILTVAGGGYLNRKESLLRTNLKLAAKDGASPGK